MLALVAVRSELMRLTVNTAIAILISLADHLINFVIGKLLTNGSHDVSQLGSGDEAVVVAVEDLCLFSRAELNSITAPRHEP